MMNRFPDPLTNLTSILFCIYSYFLNKTYDKFVREGKPILKAYLYSYTSMHTTSLNNQGLYLSRIHRKLDNAIPSRITHDFSIEQLKNKHFPYTYVDQSQSDSRNIL